MRPLPSSEKLKSLLVSAASGTNGAGLVESVRSACSGLGATVVWSNVARSAYARPRRYAAARCGSSAATA